MKAVEDFFGIRPTKAIYKHKKVDIREWHSHIYFFALPVTRVKFKGEYGCVRPKNEYEICKQLFTIN